MPVIANFGLDSGKTRTDTSVNTTGTEAGVLVDIITAIRVGVAENVQENIGMKETDEAGTDTKLGSLCVSVLRD